MADVKPGQWVNNYGDILYHFAFQRVGEASLAMDLVQDTFLSALKDLPGFEGRASEKTWLFSILKNKIIDHFRRKGRSLIVLIKESKEYETYFDADGHWEMNHCPRDWKKSTRSAVEDKEFLDVFNACKEGLKELQRIVFVMKYLDDLDSEEICKVLNITSSNYWVLLHRAKLNLRACIEENWAMQ